MALGERVPNVEIDPAELNRVARLQELRSPMMDWKYCKADHRIPNLATTEIHIVTRRPHLLKFNK